MLSGCKSKSGSALTEMTARESWLEDPLILSNRTLSEM